jgi:hypothetical protein
VLHIRNKLIGCGIAFAACFMAGAAQAQTYSPEAISDLRYMIEEEKLAGDVYRAFGVLYPTIKPFQNIPKSEDQHVATLVTQAGLAGMNVSDLTSLPANTFLNTSLQSLFTSLVAQGSTSSFAALSVGRDIELLDIDDLTNAMAKISTSSSLYGAYGSLRNASYNHLNAFNRHLAMVPPPVPEPETYAMLLAGLGLMGLVARRRRAGVAV